MFGCFSSKREPFSWRKAVLGWLGSQFVFLFCLVVLFGWRAVSDCLVVTVLVAMVSGVWVGYLEGRYWLSYFCNQIVAFGPVLACAFLVAMHCGFGGF